MIIETIETLREELKPKMNKETVGLVPTMGYLHQGHISLIKKARSENDTVVLSIFVNPTQFSPNEDLETYPRDLDKDIKAAYDNGVDYIFTPSAEEMYGKDYSTYVNIEGDITKKLCGKTRPSHFKGVTTIISKLFNIVQPNNAYFGLKDAQQFSVIKKLVKDLNFDVNIVPCPIVRDEDGLALSSRNIYLNEIERKQALVLHQSLNDAKTMYLNGNNNPSELKNYIINKINSKDLASIDYVEIVDLETLEDVDKIDRQSLVALAVKFGNTRLLDNIILGE